MPTLVRSLIAVAMTLALTGCAYPPPYWRACPPGYHLGPYGQACHPNWR